MLTATSILFDSRIQKEAQSLAEAGFSVTILSIEDQGLVHSLKNEQEILEALKRNLPGVVCHRYLLKSRAWKFLPKVVNKSVQAIEFSIKFLVGVLSHRADVYHCHDLLPAVFCWVGKWIYGGIIVYDAHELEVEMRGSGGVVKRIMKNYEKGMLRRSTLNLTVNNAIRDIMQSMYARPVHVIQNRPYHYSMEQLDRGKLRQLTGLTSDNTIAIYVGNLSMDRGIDRLVMALRYTDPHVHVVIMGTGRIEEFRQQLNAIMREYMIDEHRVQFIGPFPPTEVVQYLCGADISCMLYQKTSDNMLFNAPNKLFQSIVAQVPILASRNETFPAIVEASDQERIGVTVDESDPASIAEGIAYLVDGDIQRRCRANLATAAVNVSWSSEKHKFLELYKSILPETA